ncbi:unnamed protein product [Symbiodinium sp. CCMP2592]|nr:unnamed protein product [Symbiodinium sp. CCMP2592]
MASLSTEVRAVISGFLSKAKEGTLVQSVNALHDYLLQQKLAWRLKLGCDFIGVHPENRDGMGISASHVHDLISSIAGIGFSSAESRAVCVEIPTDSRGTACREFNARLCEEAKGKLAPVNPALLKYASIVGSHANQAARAFYHGIAHENPKVSIDGRLSLEKLSMLDPAWCSSIRDCIDWMIVSFEVTEAFPEYVGLAQSAGNAAGQIASREGELQLARKVNQAISEHMARSGKDTVCYSDVAPSILRSKPPSGSSLPGIFTFVLRYGGGEAPDSFLRKTESHIRAHGYASRCLGADFWQGMSTEMKGTTNQRVLWRHMVLKLAYCGPEKILNLADIRRAVSAKDILTKADEAEKLSIRMHQLLSSDGRLTPEVLAATRAEVEMEFVAAIFAKMKYTPRTSLEQVCHECLQGLGIPSPFAPPPATTSQASSPGKDASPGSYIACKESWDIPRLGFDKGVQVIRKADDVVAVVEEIQPDKVTLRLEDGSLVKSSTTAFIQGKWKKHTEKSQPTEVEQWWESSPSASPDFLSSVVKGRVIWAMHQQYEAFKHEKSLQIFSKPKDRLDKLNATIQLPVIKNFRRIEAEDQLIVYRPELAKSDDVEPLLPVAGPKKKARTS